VASDSKKHPDEAKISEYPNIIKLSDDLVRDKFNLEVSERNPTDLVRTKETMTSKIKEELTKYNEFVFTFKL
jgi:hypothetical protein